ncbi:hypothetical protein N5V81_12940 [Escherichia coli]|nr:hypothetical protein [Escherichia coli]
MSITRIDYRAVVKNCPKGLIELDSDEARSCGFLPHIALSEFRTIAMALVVRKALQHTLLICQQSSTAAFCIWFTMKRYGQVVEKFHEKAAGTVG